MRDTFVLRTEWYSTIEKLPTVDKAEILDAVFLYNMDREDEINFTSPLSTICWNFIKPTIDYHNKKYMTSVENGKKGGRPKNQTTTQVKPNDNLIKPNDNLIKPNNKVNKGYHNLTDTVTVTDTVIVNDIVNESVIDNVYESEIKDLMKSKKLSRSEAIKYINDLPSVEEIFIKAEEKRKEMFGLSFDNL
jgi:hypothetical protein